MKTFKGRPVVPGTAEAVIDKEEKQLNTNVKTKTKQQIRFITKTSYKL